ncbi:MAG TPA: 6-phosphogluconolactonase [Marinobacter sp.]|nr:6-phosphogluconolactonase [Marinobacter sp.]
MPDFPLPEGVEMFVADNAGQCAAQLALDVAEILRLRIRRCRSASLVVSGGSTPLPFFRALSEQDLEWERVCVVLADERWVPEGDPASNTSLVRQHLLRGRARAARYLSLRQPLCTAEQALPGIEQVLATLRLPVDVVILGMGTDGHTASLFPDAPQLELALSGQAPGRAAVMTPPSQAHTRVTLTLPVLAGARFLALHLRGDDKLETLRQALAAQDEWRAMPVRAFLKPGLRIYWSP